MIVEIDESASTVKVTENGQTTTLPIGSPDWFRIVSKLWLRAGWDTKYVYSFSWLGRPIIQLPEDMFRLQEVIYRVKPDVIIETGVAHGGSLIFYAGLFKAMGKGRVIGVDIEIRPHNRTAIETHELAPYITLVQGSSTDDAIIQRTRDEIKLGETVLVVLDSNHSKAHVLAELEAYSRLVSVGSYIVATDGIMGSLVGAPRSNSDWSWNNPREAALEFARSHQNFCIDEPVPDFNEGSITERVTYWPQAYLKRIA